MRSSIYLRYAIIGLGSTLAIFLLLGFTTSWWWYWNWLIAASVVAFFMYGMDKIKAIRDKGRTPNLILHLMSLIGGYTGAFIGRAVFHHKSNFRQNPEFLIIMVISLIISLAFIAWYIYRTIVLGA